MSHGRTLLNALEVLGLSGSGRNKFSCGSELLKINARLNVNDNY